MRRSDYFNEAIRLGRVVRGKSVRDVSEATGIPMWRLRAFERGISPVRPDEFLRIWRYLSSDEMRPAPASPARGTADTGGLLLATKSERP